MDQDMIPILERADDYDFYSPIWRYSNCHPKAPPPSPEPASDQQFPTVNLMASSPVGEFLPLVLLQRLSIVSSVTAEVMLREGYDTSSGEGYIGSEYDEKHVQHSVTARPVEATEWLTVDYGVEIASPHHPILTAIPPCDLQFDGYGSTPAREQRMRIDSDHFGNASTTPEKATAPKYPPNSAAGTNPPYTPPRTRNNDSASPQHSAGAFSVFTPVPSHASASASAGSRHREPIPVLQTERSVFEEDDGEGRRRFGSFSSHIRLPGRRGSGEREKALKRRASSFLYGILSCGWIRGT